MTSKDKAAALLKEILARMTEKARGRSRIPLESVDMENATLYTDKDRKSYIRLELGMDCERQRIFALARYYPEGDYSDGDQIQSDSIDLTGPNYKTKFGILKQAVISLCLCYWITRNTSSFHIPNKLEVI